MDPNNKRNTRNKDIDIDRYQDWRNTLILNEKSKLEVEEEDDYSDTRIQAEKDRAEKEALLAKIREEQERDQKAMEVIPWKKFRLITLR